MVTCKGTRDWDLNISSWGTQSNPQHFLLDIYVVSNFFPNDNGTMDILLYKSLMSSSPIVPLWEITGSQWWVRWSISQSPIRKTKNTQVFITMGKFMQKIVHMGDSCGVTQGKWGKPEFRVEATTTPLSTWGNLEPQEAWWAGGGSLALDFGSATQGKKREGSCLLLSSHPPASH